MADHRKEQSHPVFMPFDQSMPPPIIDAAGGGITYFGYAPVGTATGAPRWRIARQRVVGSITTTEYPEANMGFEFIWEQRATYTYSR